MWFVDFGDKEKGLSGLGDGDCQAGGESDCGGGCERELVWIGKRKVRVEKLRNELFRWMANFTKLFN